ncbi:3-ketodihydrosphingosine reductase [Coccomyxa sp. Obi]|nr:3-ketodihydrosphingosine reductase [Coccomyxa sp. Obi]
MVWWPASTRAGFWKGQHVFITGGSDGIGLALATLLLERGARVTIASRSETKLAAAKRTLKVHAGSNSLFSCSVDVGEWKQVQRAVREAEETLGPIDVVIANAGTPSSALFEELSVEEYEYINRVNYLGVIYTLKAGTVNMLKRRRGHILIVSSLSGFVALPGQTAYSATKFALRGFADALQFELAGSGVSLSIAFPGMTQSSMLDAMDARTRALIDELPSVNVYPARQVAELMLRGMEEGRYTVRFPDTMATCITSALAGTAAPTLPLWINVPLAPIVVLVMQVYRWMIKKAFWKIKTQHQDSFPMRKKTS